MLPGCIFYCPKPLRGQKEKNQFSINFVSNYRCKKVIEVDDMPIFKLNSDEFNYPQSGDYYWQQNLINLILNWFLKAKLRLINKLVI